MSDTATPTIDSAPRKGLLGESAPANRVVPALYDQLSQSLRRADSANVEGDVTSVKRELHSASTLVFELLATLNFRQGGELTPRLAALYGYFASEILSMGRSADNESLQRLIEMVDMLSGQWHAETQRQHQRATFFSET